MSLHFGFGQPIPIAPVCFGKGQSLLVAEGQQFNLAPVVTGGNQVAEIIEIALVYLGHIDDPNIQTLVIQHRIQSKTIRTG